VRSIAIRIGIIAAIAIAYFIARPFISESAGSLKAGDCFDVPSGNETIDDVQHHPCTDPHGAEVFLVAKYEPDTDVHPTDAKFEDFVAARCLPEFDTYTGLKYETELTLAIEWFVPTPESWADGGRTVICYIVNTDETNMTKPLKKAS
jgi:hypothetical protein